MGNTLRNRIDFKLVRGTLWGYPTKTLLTSVIKEVQRDNSVEIVLPNYALSTLQNHMDFSKNHDRIRVGYMGNFSREFNDVVACDEHSLILELSSFLKTTSFVCHKNIDEF